MQYDPAKSVFINTLHAQEDMGLVILLILKGSFEYLSIWPEKVNAYLTCSSHLP